MPELTKPAPAEGSNKIYVRDKINKENNNLIKIMTTFGTALVAIC